MNFGDRLKRLRLYAGLTQEELANKLGIKKQTISRYENSDREPNVRTAKSIADALGISLQELVYGKECSISSNNNEGRLLCGFRDLNEEGQEKVLAYVDDLNRAGIYKRRSESGVAQEA